MKSRYDYMQKSEVKDSVLQDFYPDPLTLDYNDKRLSKQPAKQTLTYTTALALWSLCEDAYGVPALDDVLMGMNKIPHRNMLSTEKDIRVPGLNDINNSFRK